MVLNSCLSSVVAQNKHDLRSPADAAPSLQSLGAGEVARLSLQWPFVTLSQQDTAQLFRQHCWSVPVPSSLQFPASLAHHFNFWSLIHAQACHAACTYHLLQGQAAAHYFAGNAVVLAHWTLYFGASNSSNLWKARFYLHIQNQHWLLLNNTRLNNPWTSTVHWQASLLLLCSLTSYAAILKEISFHFH